MSKEDYDIHEVIEMALSDHTSFKQIESLYGLKERDVKQLMRQNLKPGSYAAWRRRVVVARRRLGATLQPYAPSL